MSYIGIHDLFSIPILTYHHVSDDIDYYTSVKRAEFKRQLSYLVNNFEIISLKDAIKLNATPDSTQKLVISFDDGYQDSLWALNLISKNKAVADLFIPTSTIGGDNKWNHKAPYISSIFTTDEIKDLHSNGFSVGSHGKTHQTLTKLNDSELIEEIKGSKEHLRGILGDEESIFCYPFGTYDHRVKKLVTQTYTAAVATNKTSWPGNPDQFEIYRFSVNADTTLEQIKAITDVKKAPTN